MSGLKPVQELKACPFCDADAEMFSDGSGTMIRCTSDQCISRPLPYNDYGHQLAAIEAWNRRPVTAAQRGEEEAKLRKALDDCLSFIKDAHITEGQWHWLDEAKELHAAILAGGAK